MRRGEGLGARATEQPALTHQGVFQSWLGVAVQA